MAQRTLFLKASTGTRLALLVRLTGAIVLRPIITTRRVSCSDVALSIHFGGVRLYGLSGGAWVVLATGKQILLGCFAGFHDPCRKQYHANLVTQADLFLINEANAHIFDSLIQGVIFPNLQHLRLYCPKRRDYIPQLQCPSLKILEINPQFECEFGIPEYALSQEQWDKVLCRISVS